MTRVILTQENHCFSLTPVRYYGEDWGKTRAPQRNNYYCVLQVRKPVPSTFPPCTRGAKDRKRTWGFLRLGGWDLGEGPSEERDVWFLESRLLEVGT